MSCSSSSPSKQKSSPEASLHAFSEIKEITIPVNEAELFCRVLGTGEPLIVIHGGPGLTQDYLLPQMLQLAKNRQVIFYDQRGCGQSTGRISPETINIETFVSDLEEIRKWFGFEKISILGHSWGAFVAMKYTIANPDAVDKLILSNGSPASSEDLALFAEEYSRRTSPIQEKLQEITNSVEFKEGDPSLVEQYYRAIFQTYCYRPEKADLLNLCMSPTAFVNGGKVFELINLFSCKFNLHSSLGRLKIPVLIIHGDADPVPFVTAERIHKDISNSQYVLMEKCGHFPYVEDPATYFRHIEDFLRPCEERLKSLKDQA